MDKHTYRRVVQYYETDKMGAAHHSNYVRWMEKTHMKALAAYFSAGGAEVVEPKLLGLEDFDKVEMRAGTVLDVKDN